MRLGAVSFTLTFPMNEEIIAADNGRLRSQDEAREYGIDARLCDITIRDNRAKRPRLRLRDRTRLHESGEGHPLT